MQREELEKLNAKRKMIREQQSNAVVVVDHDDNKNNNIDGHDGDDDDHGHDGMIIKAKTKKMKKCDDDDINGKKKNEIKSKKMKKIVSELSNDRIDNDNNLVSINDNIRKKGQKSIKNSDKKSKEVIDKNTTTINEISNSSCNNNNNRRRHHHIDDDINGIDPMLIIDKSFQSDWEYLQRQHNKNKFEFNNWLLLWKNLKIFNNNWRIVSMPIHHHHDHDYDGVGVKSSSNGGVGGDDNHVFYTRVPGLKYDNYQQYRKNYDYFLTLSELKLYIFTQGMLISGDKTLLSFINNDDSSSSSSSRNHDKINLSKTEIETNITITKNNCERIKSQGNLSYDMLILLYIICYF